MRKSKNSQKDKGQSFRPMLGHLFTPSNTPVPCLLCLTPLPAKIIYYHNLLYMLQCRSCENVYDFEDGLNRGIVQFPKQLLFSKTWAIYCSKKEQTGFLHMCIHVAINPTGRPQHQTMDNPPSTNSSIKKQSKKQGYACLLPALTIANRLSLRCV